MIAGDSLLVMSSLLNVERPQGILAEMIRGRIPLTTKDQGSVA
jgi:hypothetical protein